MVIGFLDEARLGLFSLPPVMCNTPHGAEEAAGKRGLGGMEARY
jgi:hypothetical protein